MVDSQNDNSGFAAQGGEESGLPITRRPLINEMPDYLASFSEYETEGVLHLEATLTLPKKLIAYDALTKFLLANNIPIGQIKLDTETIYSTHFSNSVRALAKCYTGNTENGYYTLKSLVYPGGDNNIEDIMCSSAERLLPPAPLAPKKVLFFRKAPPAEPTPVPQKKDPTLTYGLVDVLKMYVGLFKDQGKQA